MSASVGLEGKEEGDTLFGLEVEEGGRVDLGGAPGDVP